jgi:hypothetical protein
MKVTKALPVAAMLLASLSACQLNKMVADNMSASLDDQKTSFYREKSLRHAREAAPSMLKLLDGFIISSPQNYDLLIRGAEMNCGFSMLMIEGEDPEWASVLYMKGYDYAMRALKHKVPNIEQVLAAGGEDALRDALAKADADAGQAIFWGGLCLGSHMNINLDDVAAMANLARVLTFMDRAIQLVPDYFYGGPEMFLGVYYGTLGVSLGGKPELSKANFEKAFEISGGKFLIAKIYFARTYCVQVQDRALFEATLNEVLAAPDDIAPELSLVTVAAKKQAQELLDKVDDLFI